MIDMIDNYDSFTFNLVQEMGKLGARMEVHRNDQIDVAGLEAAQPEALVVSPGPCTPNEAGVSIEAILAFSGKIPVLGVCLGHQSIIQAFGGKVVHAQQIMHGKVSLVRHNSRGLFEGVDSPFEGGRYHSLAGRREDMPDCLEITASSDDGEIMAVQHREHPTFGLQFHPESVLTPMGLKVMGNFLKLLPAETP